LQNFSTHFYEEYRFEAMFYYFAILIYTTIMSGIDVVYKWKNNKRSNVISWKQNVNDSYIFLYYLFIKYCKNNTQFVKHIIMLVKTLYEWMYVLSLFNSIVTTFNPSKRINALNIQNAPCASFSLRVSKIYYSTV
jgi:hypothetical protein